MIRASAAVRVCNMPGAAMRKCLFWLQEHGAPAMQLILNDLSTNNWARCVANIITGEGAPAAPDNYTVTLAPKSFYSALVRRVCVYEPRYTHTLGLLLMHASLVWLRLTCTCLACNEAVRSVGLTAASC